MANYQAGGPDGGGSARMGTAFQMGLLPPVPARPAPDMYVVHVSLANPGSELNQGVRLVCTTRVAHAMSYPNAIGLVAGSKREAAAVVAGWLMETGRLDESSRFRATVGEVADGAIGTQTVEFDRLG